MAVMAAALVGCGRSRADEKRIADLESRLAAMESKNAASTTPTSTPGVAAATPAEEKPEGPLPVAEFDTTDHDFGTINEGEKVKFRYLLKNTGQAPLIIQSAQPSCGCTVPNWTKEPIPVGGTGYVEAEFDSKGKTGMQNKTITVTSNTWPKVTQLHFKGMVTGK